METTTLESETQRELQSTALLKGVEGEALRVLMDRSRVEQRSRGDLIFREGDLADSLYLVLEGAVGIFQGGEGRAVHRLGRVDAGEFFGEMGLLNEAPRFASARVQEPCRVVRISRGMLLELVSRHPQVELQLRNVMIRRHHENVALALRKGRRRELRIQVERPVWLLGEDGSRAWAVLENLSTGGICLRREPGLWPEAVEHAWFSGAEVAFRMGGAGTSQLIEGRARIAWRRGDRFGLVFLFPTEDHEEKIRQALEVLLRPQGGLRERESSP